MLQDLGDLAGARTQYERALAISEAALGPDHPNIGTVRNNLGGVLQALGDLAGARTQLRAGAGRSARRPSAPTTPTSASARNNLGGVLQDLGDLAGARTQYERALADQRGALGPDHPDVGIRRNNLGLVLQDLGDLAGARTQYERALADHRGGPRPRPPLRSHHPQEPKPTRVDPSSSQAHRIHRPPVVEVKSHAGEMAANHAKTPTPRRRRRIRSAKQTAVADHLAKACRTSDDMHRPVTVGGLGRGVRRSWS